MAESLTTEQLKSLFQSNFQLVHQLIELARYYIHAGREFSLSGLLNEVKKNPNPGYLEELKKIHEIEDVARKRQQEQNGPE